MVTYPDWVSFQTAKLLNRRNKHRSASLSFIVFYLLSGMSGIRATLSATVALANQDLREGLGYLVLRPALVTDVTCSPHVSKAARFSSLKLWRW